ncbi:MAG TPA: AbrB/MazE/SpoVT family DNA-binding domain-containing protein [Candidatus Ozemobacteraceae bacterium]|nr:AbrB/MazE/SpoVT family DNA-binding domain-containing protein [Candidatus Ozemobacteraceae bacterium]
MSVVKVSPKFQIVIPEAVRKSMNIKPGERIQVFQFENRIELVPVRSMKEMRGFLKGLDSRIEREPDRP